MQPLTEEQKALFVRWQPFVWLHARRFHSRYAYLHAVDDFFQEGCLGLVEAVQRFDPARGTTFPTFAYWLVRKGMHNLVKNGGVVHVPAVVNNPDYREVKMRALKVLSLSTLLTLDVLDHRTPLVDHEDQFEILRRSLSRMSPRYRLVLSLRFGINGEKQHTLEEIGGIFHITRERVRQIEEQAIEHLRALVTGDTFHNPRIGTHLPPKKAASYRELCRKVLVTNKKQKVRADKPVRVPCDGCARLRFTDEGWYTEGSCRYCPRCWRRRRKDD